MLQEFINNLKEWAITNKEVESILLVGSYARNEATPESDIDLVIIVKNQKLFLENYNWIRLFGKVKEISFEDWGRVQSIRVFYDNYYEVEFGIAESIWTEIPVEQETYRIVNDGCKIVIDKSGKLQLLIDEVSSTIRNDSLSN